MMDMVIAFLEGSSVNNYIVTHSWVWPTLETLHFIGLCMLLGSLLIVDLSVIGFAPGISLRLVDKFIIVTLIGFAINATTGVFFVIGDPDRYFINIAFQLKMLTIALAGFNALYFTFRVRPEIAAGAHNFTQLGFNARISTGLSLTFWTSVIVFGRFIPYVEDL